jgi:hypothetical protein
MHGLENFMNRLTDADWGGWPVVFLRPPKDRDIDTAVLLRMTCVFGIGAGLLAIAFMFSNGIPLNPVRVLLTLLVGCVGFFFVYRVTFAHFWNRRAKRLRETDER